MTIKKNMSNLINSNFNYTENKITFYKKLFICSVVFEPLLFFVFLERDASGVVGNISRIFQALVIIGLLFKIIQKKKINNCFNINLFGGNFINYWIYLYLAIIAGLYGALVGTYELKNIPLPNNTSVISGFLNSNRIRPFFEYLANFYYFIYFVFIFQILIRSPIEINYFFKIFKYLFITSCILGVADITSLYIFGQDFLPRHLADGVHVGFRFHGLAGEPRDAFVYLFLGLAIIHLESFFKGKKLNNWLIFLIIILAMFTQSFSGLIGIACFIVLYVFYSILTFEIFKKIWQFLLLTFISFAAFYFMINYSNRIMIFIDGILVVWDYLKNDAELPYGMFEQKDNIYPLFDLVKKLTNGDFIQIAIGSGFGSASVVNNNYTQGEHLLLNPHSQFVRVIYEGGLVGLFFYTISFLYPILKLTRKFPYKNEFMIMGILLLSCTFAHRSSAIFIYLGIFIATFNQLKMAKN